MEPHARPPRGPCPIAADLGVRGCSDVVVGDLRHDRLRRPANNGEAEARQFGASHSGQDPLHEGAMRPGGVLRIALVESPAVDVDTPEVEPRGRTLVEGMVNLAQGCLPRRVDLAVNERDEVEVADTGHVVVRREGPGDPEVADPAEFLELAAQSAQNGQIGAHPGTLGVPDQSGPPPGPQAPADACVERPASALTETDENRLVAGGSRSYAAAMIYQHPIAYILGLDGVALLRAFAGEYDRAFTEARFTEIRGLLDAVGEFGDGVYATPVATREVYRDWASTYDEPGNAMIEREQPIVRDILDGLDPGVAVDAACGTGRHTAYLAELGHRVIGIDESPEMLDIARSKVPDGDFRRADLRALPLPDGIADVVVCALALDHVADLDAAMAELVRVLKPGGHLVLSDGRPLFSDVGLPFVGEQPDGAIGYCPNVMRLTSDYLRAALALGLAVRRCDEPRRLSPYVDDTGTPLSDSEPIDRYVAADVPDIWSLHPWSPAATNAAYLGTPHLIVWHFQRSE